MINQQNASKGGMVTQLINVWLKIWLKFFKLGWKTPFLGMEGAKQQVASTELCEHDMLKCVKKCFLSCLRFVYRWNQLKEFQITTEVGQWHIVGYKIDLLWKDVIQLRWYMLYVCKMKDEIFSFMIGRCISISCLYEDQRWRV